MEFICIEELVPSDHLLRKIDRSIDFSFIYDKVEGLYCSDNGRPPLDPVVFFKMLMIGYLFGVRSERQLVRDIEVNLAYRWFLGFGFRDKIPNHSIFSQNRRRRFSGTTVFQDIFDEIVVQAIEQGLVDGRFLFTDSTHLKANANKGRFERKQVTCSTQQYMEALDADVAKDRQAHGKEPLPAREHEAEVKETRVSITDPDSGYMVRDGKPTGFHYLDHRTVDDKHNIITDVHVTPGNVSDNVPYLDRLDRQCERFDLNVEAVGLDSGYFTPAICKGLEERNIYGVIPPIQPRSVQGVLKKTDFIYDEHFDCYICPQNKVLEYATTKRQGYREYISRSSDCRNCPLLHECTKSKNYRRTIKRHVWEGHKEAIAQHRYEPRGKVIHQRRKETVERSFADAKQLHGHRFARYRGIERLREQCLMVALCQNIKKMALLATNSTADGSSDGLISFIRELYALMLSPRRRRERIQTAEQITESPVHGSLTPIMRRGKPWFVNSLYRACPWHTQVRFVSDEECS